MGKVIWLCQPDDPQPPNPDGKTKKTGACIRSVLGNKGVEGLYFPLENGNKWKMEKVENDDLRPESYVQKIPRINLLKCALYKNEEQENKHQISQLKKKIHADYKVPGKCSLFLLSPSSKRDCEDQMNQCTDYMLGFYHWS